MDIELLLGGFIVKEELYYDEKQNNIYTKVTIEKEKKVNIYNMTRNLFLNYDDVNILFIMDFKCPLHFKLNKKHPLGKLISKNVTDININLIFNLLHRGTKKTKNKKLPKRYRLNSSMNFISKKAIKFTNKQIQKITKQLAVDPIKIDKTNFFRIK
jgi:hypothetical protein